MATLAVQFKGALSRIEPKDDAQHAATAHQQVSDALRADDLLKRLGVDPKLIGSYGRDVSIRRVKDVDVFARLWEADERIRPGAILDHVAAVLDGAFPGHASRQHRSVKVDFPDFDLSVDVVIARPCIHHPREHWQIPQQIDQNGQASWIETNPLKMGELTTEYNKRFLLNPDDESTGIYVPVVKLVRQIRRIWVNQQPGGYYFEVLTFHAFQQLDPRERTVAQYLTPVLGHIAEQLTSLEQRGPLDPTMAGKRITTKATPAQVRAAAQRIKAASELAAKALALEDPCRSAVAWQQLFGETQGTQRPETVFLLPDRCNPDGTTKSASGVTRGAPSVPAGDDRYA